VNVRARASGADLLLEQCSVWVSVVLYIAVAWLLYHYCKYRGCSALAFNQVTVESSELYKTLALLVLPLVNLIL